MNLYVVKIAKRIKEQLLCRVKIVTPVLKGQQKKDKTILKK
jgi:hypothetical protein